jgi:hypothetical protein
MKYSKWIGVLAAIVVIASCYMVWIKVPSANLEIAGMFANGKHNLGKPGLMNMVVTIVAAVLFLLPFIWAKRTNVFICALNIAWAVRNYVLLGKCYAGDCPVKESGLYILVAASLVMLLMSLLPDVELKEEAGK